MSSESEEDTGKTIEEIVDWFVFSDEANTSDLMSLCVAVNHFLTFAELFGVFQRFFHQHLREAGGDEAERLKIQKKADSFIEAYSQFENLDEVELKTLQDFLTEHLPSNTSLYRLQWKEHRNALLTNKTECEKLLHEHMEKIGKDRGIIQRKKLPPTLFQTQGILRFEPNEIAENMTMLEQIYFMKISRNEYLSEDLTKNCPNISIFADQFNNTTNWIASEVMAAADSAQQALFIRHFIDVGNRLFEIHNYNGAMEIICALNKSVIQQLHKAWEIVPQASKDEFAKLENTLTPMGNFREYRNVFHEIRQTRACIPYLACHLKDLTFAHEGNRYYFKSGLINVEKLKIVGRIVGDVLSAKKFLYAYPINEEIIHCLLHLWWLDELDQRICLFFHEPGVKKVDRLRSLAAVVTKSQIFTTSDLPVHNEDSSGAHNSNIRFSHETVGEKSNFAELVKRLRNAASQTNNKRERKEILYEITTKLYNESTFLHRKDRVWKHNVFYNSFSGTDFVDCLIRHTFADSIKSAIELGKQIISYNFIVGLTGSGSSDVHFPALPVEKEFKFRHDVFYQFNVVISENTTQQIELIHQIETNTWKPPRSEQDHFRKYYHVHIANNNSASNHGNNNKASTNYANSVKVGKSALAITNNSKGMKLALESFLSKDDRYYFIVLLKGIHLEHYWIDMDGYRGVRGKKLIDWCLNNLHLDKLKSRQLLQRLLDNLLISEVTNTNTNQQYDNTNINNNQSKVEPIAVPVAPNATNTHLSKAQSQLVLFGGEIVKVLFDPDRIYQIHPAFTHGEIKAYKPPVNKSVNFNQELAPHVYGDHASVLKRISPRKLKRRRKIKSLGYLASGLNHGANDASIEQALFTVDEQLIVEMMNPLSGIPVEAFVKIKKLTVSVFKGSSIIHWLQNHLADAGESDALLLAHSLFERKIVCGYSHRLPLSNNEFLYRFSKNVIKYLMHTKGISLLPPPDRASIYIRPENLAVATNLMNTSGSGIASHSVDRSPKRLPMSPRGPVLYERQTTNTPPLSPLAPPPYSIPSLVQSRDDFLLSTDNPPLTSRESQEVQNDDSAWTTLQALTLLTEMIHPVSGVRRSVVRLRNQAMKLFSGHAFLQWLAERKQMSHPQGIETFNDFVSRGLLVDSNFLNFAEFDGDTLYRFSTEVFDSRMNSPVSGFMTDRTRFNLAHSLPQMISPSAPVLLTPRNPGSYITSPRAVKFASSRPDSIIKSPRVHLSRVHRQLSDTLVKSSSKKKAKSDEKRSLSITHSSNESVHRENTIKHLKTFLSSIKSDKQLDVRFTKQQLLRISSCMHDPLNFLPMTQKQSSKNTYSNCFTGVDATAWLNKFVSENVKHASGQSVAQQLLTLRIIRPIGLDKYQFVNDDVHYYRFSKVAMGSNVKKQNKP